MKIAYIHLVVINSALLISCDNTSPKSNRDETKKQIVFEKEQKAIFQLFKKETSSFYTRDYMRSPTDYKSRAKNNGDAAFDAEGWQELDREIEKYIKQHPEVVSRR
jgi:hypothetical protein